METRHHALLIMVLALLALMGLLWRVRLELQSLTQANEYLKKTLGEMAIALAAKDREIARLEGLSCMPQPRPGPASETVLKRKSLLSPAATH